MTETDSTHSTSMGLPDFRIAKLTRAPAREAGTLQHAREPVARWFWQTQRASYLGKRDGFAAVRDIGEEPERLEYRRYLVLAPPVAPRPCSQRPECRAVSSLRMVS